MGTNPNSSTLIGDIATDIGFKSVRPYLPIYELEKLAKSNPILFFLFDYSAEFEKTKKHIDQIRAAKDLRVRFAPLVCFVESPSKDTLHACIDAGFDDILTLPWSNEKIGVRFSKLINTNQIYFETENYLGPDRRRFDKNSEQRALPNPSPGAGFRRYEFIRNKFAGVQIINEKVIGKRPAKKSATKEASLQHRMSW